MSVTGTGITILAVSLSGFFSPFWESASHEASEGTKAYREGDYAAAADHYRRSLIEEPDAVVNFNLGGAAYRQENWEEAQRSYELAALSEEVPAGKSEYNLGNVRHKNQDLAGALEAYRAALRRDPDNEDARFNYELTLRQLQSEEQQQQEQQQDEQDEGDEENQEQQPSEGESGEDQESQSAPEDNQESPAPGDEQEQNAAQSSSGEEQEGQLLTPEQAMQLLNAITPEERELIKARLKAAQKTRVEKDW